MNNPVLKFNEFLNEELNITRYDNDVCRFSDRWFFYNQDDDIIYGCNEKPASNDILFSFNPSSCTVILGGEEKQYDVNNPLCLIHYNLSDETVSIFTEDAIKFLNDIGFNGSEVTSLQSRNKLQDMFELQEDDKYLLIYGDQMLASTFDVIEEN